MEYLTSVLTTLLSIIALFFMTKLMGKKQISQLNLFDYIIGISIGSIAAELATEIENPVKPLIALILYGVIAFAISFVTSKSLKLRIFFTGKPVILMENGKIYKNRLMECRIDINDFLTLCRIQGYFDISQIAMALMEHNGSLSILPTSVSRPVTASDVNSVLPQEELQCAVILDGEIIDDNLSRTGKNRVWLKNEMKKQKYRSEKEIFLALCTIDGTLSIYPVVNG